VSPPGPLKEGTFKVGDVKVVFQPMEIFLTLNTVAAVESFHGRSHSVKLRLHGDAGTPTAVSITASPLFQPQEVIFVDRISTTYFLSFRAPLISSSD